MQTSFHAEQAEPSHGDAERLRNKAAECRRMAIGIADRYTATALQALAEEYERDASHSATRAMRA